ncbi:TPA: type V toxin-antitoxin system endoribonuclease antitoxin GhoS [Klebsiella michiganensis]
MAKFTVRVELCDSEDADYDALHKKMEAEGFSREITTSSGNTYDLPSAEYIYESEAKTTEDVGLLAKQIASKIKPRPRILATKSDGRWVSGLDKP